eukprot:CAMPEP_0119109582 /NCGR_PEP_ID=MMETSP1180-20130426/20756_1 /TAXON_ID=3052 ORGANISM="Chlamydomonas cf sp, Strain CCMP681" /NCGR_SAMPLE_ID=MMETSP1180 /ASSEMBLY_ACC=CAM_ASM_000741 /LENGTH=55 /DNA_ID=CAMNT_0007095419 /DNA_START=250 /DNA_END=414 /DNA_ORIENTATION=+
MTQQALDLAQSASIFQPTPGQAVLGMLTPGAERKAKYNAKKAAKAAAKKAGEAAS